MTKTDGLLLGGGDVAPVGIERAAGTSPYLLICDHAGNRVPATLARLGLQDAELSRHIAWDLGVLELSRHVSRELDATLIYQRYSRLVIDCNRPPRSRLAIPMASDGTDIACNADLSEREWSMRVDEVFTPYHAAIDSLLQERVQAGREPILISMHSFTPRLKTSDEVRPWHMAVLFNRCRDFPLALARALMQEGDIQVGVNEPYAVEDASDYAIPIHGERRGLRHALLEVRQDIIATPEQRALWGGRLARVLRTVEKAGR